MEDSQVEVVSLTSHPREVAARKVEPGHKEQRGESPRIGADGRNGEVGGPLIGPLENSHKHQ